MRTLALAGALLLVAAVPCRAQAPDGSAARAAMEQLAFMVGDWEGDAWMQRGAERVPTRMRERVRRELGGTVFLVEGRGETIAAAGAPARLVHHALAIVSHDAQQSRYTMRSHIGSGLSGDFVLTPVDGGVQWTREVQGGRVRNTARIGGDTWHEVGEFSSDGVTWRQIMEMRLHRVGSEAAAADSTLRAAELAFAATMADRDADAFATFLAEDAVFVNGGQPLRGKAAIVAHWRQYFGDGPAPFAWAPETAVAMDAAGLGYTEGPVLDPSGATIARFHTTWRRDADGRWRVVFDNGYTVPPCACNQD